uniref:Uncharacterized protein n=1 Tax=Anguilla anguilla TaxID=7936 RepID=A0A0E9XBA3_ANGAN
MFTLLNLVMYFDICSLLYLCRHYPILPVQDKVLLLG